MPGRNIEKYFVVLGADEIDSLLALADEVQEVGVLGGDPQVLFVGLDDMPRSWPEMMGAMEKLGESIAESRTVRWAKKRLALLLLDKMNYYRSGDEPPILTADHLKPLFSFADSTLVRALIGVVAERKLPRFRKEDVKDVVEELKTACHHGVADYLAQRNQRQNEGVRLPEEFGFEHYEEGYSCVYPSEKKHDERWDIIGWICHAAGPILLEFADCAPPRPTIAHAGSGVDPIYPIKMMHRLRSSPMLVQVRIKAYMS